MNMASKTAIRIEKKIIRVFVIVRYVPRCLRRSSQNSYFFETNRSEWHVTIKDLLTSIEPMNR